MSLICLGPLMIDSENFDQWAVEQIIIGVMILVLAIYLCHDMRNRSMWVDQIFCF